MLVHRYQILGKEGKGLAVLREKKVLASFLYLERSLKNKQTKPHGCMSGSTKTRF